MTLDSFPTEPAEYRRRIPAPLHGEASLRTQTNHPAVSEGTVRRWRAFALLVVAYFMTIVDLTIVNVALPTIGVKLHFPESDLQWVVTAYGLTFGGFLLLGGRAADLLGRRRLLMVGLAVFSAASLACGLATSDTFLIIMRGFQGLGAAIVLPAALSIVMNMFPEGAERNKALGIWGAMGAMGATVGLLAGGLLTSYVGWRYIFFLNVPIGAAALALAPKVVPESKVSAARRRYDPFGAASITSALVVLVYALSEAPQVGWGATQTPGHAYRGGGSARRVLRHRESSRSTTAAAATVPAENSCRFQRSGLPAHRELLYLHLHRHPVHAAGARVLGCEDRAGLADHFSDRFGFRRAVSEAGHKDLAQARHGHRDGSRRSRHPVDHADSADGSFWQDLAGPFFVAGIGVAFAFIPVSIGALTGVTEGDAGVASGLISTSQQLGGAIGVAVASSVAASRFHTLVHQGYSTPAALTSGFTLALWVCGLTAIVAVPMAFAVIRRAKTVKAVESTQQRDVAGSSRPRGCRYRMTTLRSESVRVERARPSTGRAGPQNTRSIRRRNQQPIKKKERIMSIRQLAGTTAIVTGASRGFGRAISVSLVERGAQVVGVARNQELLAGLKKELGEAFAPEVADVTDPSVATRTDR